MKKVIMITEPIDISWNDKRLTFKCGLGWEIGHSSPSHSRILNDQQTSSATMVQGTQLEYTYLALDSRELPFLAGAG